MPRNKTNHICNRARADERCSACYGADCPVCGCRIFRDESWGRNASMLMYHLRCRFGSQARPARMRMPDAPSLPAL